MEAKTVARKPGRRPILVLKPQEIIPTEREECVAFWDYCQRVLRLGKSVYHIPNEGMREGWYAKALVKIGLTPGVLDFFFQKHNKRWHGLYIDMKRRNRQNHKKDADQEAFIENALKDGYYACYAYGFDDALRIYTDYVNDKL